MEGKENRALAAGECKEEDLFAKEVGFEVRGQGIYCLECYQKVYGRVVCLGSCEIIDDVKEEKEFRRGTSGFFLDEDEVILCCKCWRVILRIPPARNYNRRSCEYG